MKKAFPVDDLARDDRFVRVDISERMPTRAPQADRRNGGGGRLTPNGPMPPMPLVP